MFSPQTLIIGRPIYAKDRDCGYCHASKTNSFALKSWKDHYSGSESPQSITIGFSLENISLQDYEILCNKGFRRSGTFLYKPDLLRNCCRLYTIRTSYDMFKLNKDQRKAMNKFIKQLSGEDEIKRKKGPIDLYNVFQDFETTIDKSKFYTKLEPASFSLEKYELYKKYQIAIHHDEPSKLGTKSFKRFLCDNPFHEETSEGHVHELYYINGKLLAILVLDILPQSVSSVYFIWDPEYHQLGLGKISSLRELNLCKKMGKKWYYLGYYIPDCEKMKYKRNFGGELLDVTDYKYYRIDELERKQILCKNEDKLFVIGDEYDNGKEKYIDESEEFKSMAVLENVVEKIYGIGNKVFQDASLTLDKLSDCYKPDTNTLFNLPDVIPGLVPLPQIADNLDKIRQGMGIVIYDPFDELVRYKFGKNKAQDKIVIDLVRILGFKMIQNAVIVIY